MEHLINKGMVKPWLRKLTKNGILVAPTQLEGGDVIFKEAFTPDKILLDFKQPLYSVKSYFLPQEETLFTFKNRSVETLKEVFDEYPRIFFGLRPCDLRAITQADRFFGENYQDPFYNKRRQRNLLIAIACNTPESHCFCHAMGLNPFSSEGADVFLVDLGKSFLVTSKTPKGSDAVNNFMYFFQTAGEEEKAMVNIEKINAEQKLKSNLPLADASPCYSLIDDQFLTKISNKCASCGSCSYICPMCFCYNVVDRENKELEGKRIRSWDSCIFEGFTRMAGRHNLLKNRQQRLKKRLAHKLLQYPEQYQIPGCTGCGRCSETCMGKIGMLDIIKNVTAEVSKDE